MSDGICTGFFVFPLVTNILYLGNSSNSNRSIPLIIKLQPMLIFFPGSEFAVKKVKKEIDKFPYIDIIPSTNPTMLRNVVKSIHHRKVYIMELHLLICYLKKDVWKLYYPVVRSKSLSFLIINRYFSNCFKFAVCLRNREKYFMLIINNE